jgi:metal-responsive CopG/Arc/MetJ family transcriptional regulator
VLATTSLVHLTAAIHAMKTTVSIPNTLFVEAEQFAQNQGLKRSELYAKALAFYLESQRRESITEALNRIYDIENSTLDPAIMAAQLRAIGREEW